MKRIQEYNLPQSNQLTVDYKLNIYDELAFLKAKLYELEEKFASHQIGKDHLHISEEHAISETMNIGEIIKYYKISRQSFWLYRKLLVLKPMVVDGKTFLRKDVRIFFIKIAELRKKKPDLFISESLKKRKSSKLLSQIRVNVRPI